MNRIKNGIIRILIFIFPLLDWFFQFRQANRKSLECVGIIKKIWAFRKGFYLESIRINGITNDNVTEYLSDRTYLKLHPINKVYSSIIDNKLYLPYLLKDYPDLVPAYYFFIDKGRLVKINNELSDNKGLLQLCKENQRLALKHCYSSYGKGFYVLEWKENYFYLNNKPLGESKLLSFIDSLENYIVTEYIYQNKIAAEINPQSINTVRVLCVLDHDTGEFFIARAYHRFGMSGSFTDNLGGEGGGILALIEIPTGRLKNIGLLRKKDKALEVINVTIHPDSRKQIAGVFIPNWSDTVNRVLSVMDHLSFLKYVGLDLVITENGFKIIEMNSLTSLSGSQMEEGLLKDERLNKFFLGL